MAQHDYVIDNSTGANVRADINSALLAISSNNSGSSAPSTTYALQTFANTTDSMLQLRNSANNAFVNLRKFDGTLPLPDGSASSPSLFFDDDTNTGLFSSAADTFNVATGGVERMELGATTIFNEDGADVDFRIEGDTEANLFYVDAGNDRIGIGTNSPTDLVHVKDTSIDVNLLLEATGSNKDARIKLLAHSGGVSQIQFGDGDDGNIGLMTYDHSDNSLAFRTNNAERIRIDSSGHLLVAHSSQRNNFFSAASTEHAPIIQLEGTNQNRAISITAANQDGGMLVLARQNGSVGANTVVSSGDQIGRIEFQGSGGTNMEQAAQITAEVDGTPGDNDMPGRLLFKTTADGANSPTERIRIDSSGHLRFAGTSEEITLQTSDGSDNGNLNLSGGGACSQSRGAQLILHGNESSGLLGTLEILAGNAGSASSVILFFTGGSEVARIDSSGNLGVGVSNPSTRLDVFETGNVVTGRFGCDTASAVCCDFKNTTSSGTAFFARFIYDSSGVGSITSTGSSTAFNTSSDYRLKENAVLISDGITRLKTLKPYRFNWKTDKSITVDGFFAHEVTAVPESVTGTKDELATEDIESKGVKKGDPIYQSIDHSKLVPLLVAAVQELIGKVEALEAA